MGLNRDVLVVGPTVDFFEAVDIKVMWPLLNACDEQSLTKELYKV